MTEETGAAAPSEVPAVTAPATTEKATPTDPGVSKEAAAPENAETKEQETQEASEDGKPNRLSRWQRMQRKNARLATMLAEQSAELETLRAKNSDAPRPPQEADFNGDYFAFNRALTKFEMEQTLDSRLSKLVPVQQKPDARALNKDDIIEDLKERITAAQEVLPDYQQSLASLRQHVGDLSDAVLEEIGESEKGEFILYHLAKNPKLAVSINRMSERDAAREIARLESKVSLPQPKKQTQAPAPLTPLKGGSSASKNPEEMSMSEYVTWRKGQQG